MTDLANLEAWAISQGYDPAQDYRDTDEGNEAPAAPAPSLPPGQLTTNFNEREFACRHCGELPPNGVDRRLVEALQSIRDRYGAPMTINSGYRCPTHNRAVGGASNSQHLLGTAADFTVRGVSPAKVFADLDPTWPGGLGRYNSFTHIDTRASRARW